MSCGKSWEELFPSNVDQQSGTSDKKEMNRNVHLFKAADHTFSTVASLALQFKCLG